MDRLKLDGAQWCSDPDLQKSRAREFYAHLYTAEPCLPCDSQDWNFPTLCHRDRSWLNRPVVAQEIYEAISQMGAYKAPGPDGFPPCLFQIYWHILGDKVTEAVQNIFFRGKLIDDLNNVLICLIPKCKVPESFSQFRPISLCNVLVKVVSKILANRLRPLMASLMENYQASFISGRSTSDNIIVAQEVVHSLQRLKGRKGGFILKVNLEKAYDRVDWGFLGKVLKCTGFKPEFVNIILDCIPTAEVAVCWNGESLTSFKPSRGLRQGDPLAPYLFVLCMEVLSQRISKAVEQRQWKPIRTSRTGSKISHIFFC